MKMKVGHQVRNESSIKNVEKMRKCILPQSFRKGNL
jgi:hypothetical protein